MSKCYGRRDPKEGEPPDFYIGDEPIWVCLKCGGNGCPEAEAGDTDG